ncbi:hypothetical protein K439DRAFT_1616519 [Ramaria rubella]|nr:hypothetical protein K439DRAFT_1616519 [Ramaria rubella]
MDISSLAIFNFAIADVIPHILAASIRFLRDCILGQKDIRDPKGVPPPLMGPTLHNAVACLAYEDAILHIANEDVDGNIWKQCVCGTCQPTKSRPKAATPTNKTTTKVNNQADPQPPTAASKAKARRRQEKQREDHLAHNQQEIDAHNVNVFFPENPPATPLPPPMLELPTLRHHAEVHMALLCTPQPNPQPTTTHQPHATPHGVGPGLRQTARSPVVCIARTPGAANPAATPGNMHLVMTPHGCAARGCAPHIAPSPHTP